MLNQYQYSCHSACNFQTFAIPKASSLLNGIARRNARALALVYFTMQILRYAHVFSGVFNQERRACRRIRIAKMNTCASSRWWDVTRTSRNVCTESRITKRSRRKHVLYFTARSRFESVARSLSMVKEARGGRKNRFILPSSRARQAPHTHALYTLRIRVAHWNYPYRFVVYDILATTAVAPTIGSAPRGAWSILLTQLLPKIEETTDRTSESRYKDTFSRVFSTVRHEGISI